jgi:two-component system, NtrC family, response regulator GlrR
MAAITARGPHKRNPCVRAGAARNRRMLNPMAAPSSTFETSAPGYDRRLLRCSPHLAWRDARGHHDQLVDRTLVLGTAEHVDLALADRAVSRLHAELDPRDSGLWVRDLGSLNGTFINGVRVASACIPEAGTLKVGGTELQVRYASEPHEIELWPEPEFGAMVGPSVVMRELFARLARVARSNSPVLITGETGTGKELAALALHDHSDRAGGPFVTVDCGALPESLLESELFGHDKGAFTGATAARAGAIESAEGGTVFLDEIGELPLALQPKLLRVIEARTIRRLGENHHRPVDVRFIAATHRDLKLMVSQGVFREDLYFRLAVLPICIPPLREHRQDIPALLARLLPPGSGLELTPSLLRELTDRPWLGNVRELRNVLERMAVLGQQEGQPDRPSAAAPGELTLDLPPEWAPLPYKAFRDRGYEALERAYLRGLLARFEYKISAAAEAAQIHRTYLHRLIRRYGL